MLFILAFTTKQGFEEPFHNHLLYSLQSQKEFITISWHIQHASNTLYYLIPKTLLHSLHGSQSYTRLLSLEKVHEY